MAGYDRLRDEFLKYIQVKAKVSNTVLESYRGYLDEFHQYLAKNNIPFRLTGMNWPEIRKKYLVYLRKYVKTTGSLEDKIRLIEKYLTYVQDREAAVAKPVSKEEMKKEKGSKTGSYLSAIFLGIIWIVISFLMITKVSLPPSTVKILYLSMISAIILVIVVILLLSNYLKKRS